MKNRGLFSILLLFILALGVVIAPAVAQDEEEVVEEPAYGIPEGYEVSESTNGTVTMTSEENTIQIVSPEAYGQFFTEASEFETDVEELTFFLDRANYTVGSEQSVLPTGALAGVGVSLSRRDVSQSGVAYLYDTGLERFAVISLFEGRGQVGAPADDVEVVVSGFEFTGNIVEIAIENALTNDDREGLSYLVAAVTNANDAVAETLSGEGPYTVFAPNNQAFINLFAFLQENYGITAADLLADENQALLTQVLLYHVVEGEVLAADVVGLTDGALVPTLLDVEQDSIRVNFLSDGTPVLNGGVDLVATDILASNGVVHIINDVLIPDCVVATLEGTGSC